MTDVGAHDVSDGRYVARTTTYCVYESALLRENSAEDGYARGRLRTYKSDCGTAVNRPTEHLAQAFVVRYSKTQGGTQSACMASQWYHNLKPEWGFTAEIYFPPIPYCGAGWYEVVASGYLWRDGAWRGGSVSSGRHYLNK